MCLQHSLAAHAGMAPFPPYHAGSHLEGVHRRFLRAADGSVRFDVDMPSFEGLAGFVPVEVKAGSLVLLHGGNVHLSKENTSPHSRHAYSMHFVEGAPGFSYPPDNWLQRPAELPFEPLFDAAAGAPAAAAGSAGRPAGTAAFAQPRGRSSARRPAAVAPQAAVRVY